ncbi:hypothetical protein TNCV_1542801 [Trichonephila clavipes]|nr:hypothetical protein TNCV_1542801 [Trichonephila clavipes]
MTPLAKKSTQCDRGGHRTGLTYLIKWMGYAISSPHFSLRDFQPWPNEENEKLVGVILNGSESELVFSEHQYVSDSHIKDQKPQHFKCPTGEDSWCFFQAALVCGEIPGAPVNQTP